jgi:glycosyltransferase involved in cell wall biosynthesis
MSDEELAGVRVAVDGRYLGRPGMGISRYLYAVIGLLEEAGATLTLLVDHTTSLPPACDHLKRIVLRNRSRFGWEQFSVARYLARARDYDVYYAPGNYGMPLFHRKRGRRVVITVHDLVPLRFPKRYGRRPLSYLEYCVSLATSVLRADAILVDSHFVAGELRKTFGRPALVTSLPLAKLLADPGRGDLPGVGRARPYFVYNGGADERKNVGALILAFEVFHQVRPDYELVILGRGYDRYERLARDRGIRGVVFAGYVEEAEKWRLIRGARALVYPSEMEGYGLPIVEGFAEGTVVLCANNSSLCEVGGQGVVFLESTTATAIADGLERVAAMGEADRAAQVARGREQLDRLVRGFRRDLLIDAFQPRASPPMGPGAVG